MKRATETIVRAALAADGEISRDQIARALLLLKGKLREEVASRTAVAVRQSRVAEMMDCSRFHVRKLERLGVLKTVDLAGLKRYPISEVLKLMEVGQ